MLVEISQNRACFQQRNEELLMLENENYKLNNQNKNLRNENTTLVVRMHAVETEKNKTADKLTEVTEGQQAMAKDLQGKLQQAHETIKVQSDQIKSKEGTQLIHTPYRQPSSQHSVKSGGYEKTYQERPPSFDLVPYTTPSKIRATQTLGYHSQPMEYNAPSFNKWTSQRSNPFEDDMPKLPATDAFNTYSFNPTSRRPSAPLPSVGEHYMTWGQPPYQNAMPSYQNIMLPQTVYKFHHHLDSLTPPLTKFFKDVEAWAKHYCNLPDEVRDKRMPLIVRHKLAAVTNPSMVAALIGTSQTRWLAITKLILVDMLDYAFQAKAVKGYTPEFDQRLFNARSVVHGGVPSYVRHNAAVESAAIIEELISSRAWPRHLRNNTGFQARQQYDDVESLLDADVNKITAWGHFHQLWEEAMKIGMTMLRRESFFEFSFPPVGNNVFFNPANMVNRDAKYNHDPKTLGEMGLKVRLAITPVVLETKMEANMMVSVRPLTFANVLLM